MCAARDWSCKPQLPFRNGKSTRAEYDKVLADANRQFGALAMSWSVSTPHTYPYILRSLRLK